jgi:hypothetical protein
MLAYARGELAPTLILRSRTRGSAACSRRAPTGRSSIRLRQLMSDRQLTEAEAFRWLRRQAMDSRQRLGDVARKVLTSEAVLAPVPEGAR